MNVRLMGAVAAVMLLLSGCVDGQPEPQPGVTATMPGTPSGDESSAPVVDTIPQALWNTVIVPPPPLAQYAPYIDGPQPTAAEGAKLTQWFSQTQDEIAACMASRGFRYVPVTSPDYTPGVAGLGGYLLVLPVPFLDPDRTVVEHNGYGVLSVSDSATVEGDDDPNEAYRESLSPAEADAYSIALNGDYTVPTTDGSCSAQATNDNPKPAAYSDRLSAFNTENGDVIHSMGMAIKIDFPADPRVVKLNRQWEDCMNAKGYTFDEYNTGTGPQAAMVLAERTRPDGTVASPQPGVPVAQIPQEEISLMGTEPEREVALADFDCRASTDYMTQLTAIRVQMDGDFIAANGDALQRLTNSQ